MVAAARAAGPVVVVDAGGSLVRTSMKAEPHPEQARVKAGIVAEALALAGIDGMALGPHDWTLGRAEVDALVRAHRLPILAANLTCDGVAPFPGSTVVERGGKRIGIVGFTAGVVDGCVVGDPIAVGPSVLAALGPVDVTIALLPLMVHDLGRWGDAGLGADVVIEGGRGIGRDAAEAIGPGWMLGAGRKGQSLGLATLRFVPGASGWSPADEAGHHSLTFRLVPLGADLADEPATAAVVERGKARIGEVETAHSPPHADGVAVRAGPRPFAGAAACAGCHPTQHAQWSATGHARAWATLEADGRAMDGDCAPCHATGYGAPGGPTRPAAVGDLAAVQCEACHGPAAAHVADPSVRPTRSPAVEVCTGCHDGARDEGRFDRDTYLPRVAH